MPEIAMKGDAEAKKLRPIEWEMTTPLFLLRCVQLWISMAGKNYLVQHSAGSGKSNSIAWTAYRLASLLDGNNKPIFSSVIVVTDRTVLDAQL